ncbi:cytochrome P450 [Phaeosphaeriaceae sp. PMI808]|nr:cytochrome P450 [Phaeosphaeriaceae sp. PMI808]
MEYLVLLLLTFLIYLAYGTYEAYYDLILGGQYTFKIGELHKRYGPDFYGIIYALATAQRKSDKYPFFTRFMGLDLCVFATVEHDLHRKRRAALLPFFSKASVRRLQPVIIERVDRVLNASCMFSALTNDVISLIELCLKLSDSSEDLNFDPWARDASLHAPWINQLLKKLPESKRTSEAQVLKIIGGESEGWRSREHPTIFHEVLSSKLPPEEKTIERLADDAQMVVMAGTLTTAATLEIIFFWLLSQPETFMAIPNLNDASNVPPPTLEALPYLTAVIKEGLHLSYGVMTFTDKDTGKKWVIPAGTPVGSTSVLIYRDESFYPNSEKFSPERWLDGRGSGLEKYLVSFCVGSRRCFGENLAYAEIYVGLAAIWRVWGSCDEHGMSLWETTKRDVEIESD